MKMFCGTTKWFRTENITGCSFHYNNLKVIAKLVTNFFACLFQTPLENIYWARLQVELEMTIALLKQHRRSYIIDWKIKLICLEIRDRNWNEANPFWAKLITN